MNGPEFYLPENDPDHGMRVRYTIPEVDDGGIYVLTRVKDAVCAISREGHRVENLSWERNAVNGKLMVRIYVDKRRREYVTGRRRFRFLEEHRGSLWKVLRGFIRTHRQYTGRFFENHMWVVHRGAGGEMSGYLYADRNEPPEAPRPSERTKRTDPPEPGPQHVSFRRPLG